jgi:DNA-binding response OmpR family regulator
MGLAHEQISPGATERAPAHGVDRGAALIWVASLGLREVVQLALQRDGFRVTPVGTAPVLVRLLAAARAGLRRSSLATLALIDVPTPDDGCLEVIASARLLAPDLRILALVNRLERAVAMDAYRLGASRVIAKPLSLDALHRAAVGR